MKKIERTQVRMEGKKIRGVSVQRLPSSAQMNAVPMAECKWSAARSNVRA